MNDSTPDSTFQRGIVLFAHGSRDPLWHKPMEAVAQRVRAQSPAANVVCAYLELSQPDLPTSAAALVAQGLSEITIVPMFLGVGKHAREDLPLIMEALQLSHPQITFELKAAIGEQSKMIELMAQIALS